ncbi:M20 metallopeptidase family protein [Flavihumibacter fluvii]|uniref:M20 metallopeptidase family protein n=1 Tax=Flavihumibacter fluvii TaxID=2838157 RepID=UPI001BDE49F9|nr:M20 family metallopeptidase [Flavihumibacter fluvii]ULQ52730.1 M20 family metallopeptidase [Flavihumibacter fluvii]
MKTAIRALAAIAHARIIENRRHLHANPELSYQEKNTSAYIKSCLDELGISWKPMAETGVVAVITGELASDKVVALRADIDALPINELTNLPFRSNQAGVMHACGHDAHTASLLGVAFILQSLRNSFAGTVKLIFQPGEEKLPGGASIMIKEGVLDNPVPMAVIGQHVMPSIAAGKIGIRKGKFMASMDELYVRIKGKGGHGAMPNQNIDPVLIASHIVVALQQIVSRTCNPLVPAVLSFGRFIADGSNNIIPDEVLLEGTFRTVDEKQRCEAHEHMRQLACGLAESLGASCDFDIRVGYPVLVNAEELTNAVKTYAAEYMGSENIEEVDIWMAAEDFSYYSQATDACFYLLGIAKEDGIKRSLHSPFFDLDESALEAGAGLMAYIALKQLGN